MSDAKEAMITPLGDGRVLVDRGGIRTVAYAAVEGTITWVFLDGQTFVVESSRTTAGRARSRDDDTALAAPMPAMVVAVNVAAGQPVSRGDVLIMLEAMKMELPIRAPRDAHVKAVACRPGELVQAGVPLLELE